MGTPFSSSPPCTSMLWLVGGSDKLVCIALLPLQWSPWWLGGICLRPILVGVQPGSHLALIDTFSERDPVADNPLCVVGMDPA